MENLDPNGDNIEHQKGIQPIRIPSPYSKKKLITFFTSCKKLKLPLPCNQLVQLLRLVNFTVFYLGPLLIAYTALQANLAINKSQKPAVGIIFEDKKSR
jgi:hypothetical protein